MHLRSNFIQRQKNHIGANFLRSESRVKSRQFTANTLNQYIEKALQKKRDKIFLPGDVKISAKKNKMNQTFDLFLDVKTSDSNYTSKLVNVGSRTLLLIATGLTRSWRPGCSRF